MGASPRIVLIDDDEILLAVVSRFLTVRGFDVHASPTGFGISHAVHTLKPDAIVLDMALPALDGPRCAALIRERFGEDIPIILWSGSDEAIVRHAARAVANAVSVPKAGGVVSLHEALCRFLERRTLPERTAD